MVYGVFFEFSNTLTSPDPKSMATHEYDRGHSSSAVADPIVGEYRIKYMYVYLYEYGCFVVVVLFCGCILRSIQRVLGMLHAYVYNNWSPGPTDKPLSRPIASSEPFARPKGMTRLGDHQPPPHLRSSTHQ